VWQGRKGWRSCQELPLFILADGKREDSCQWGRLRITQSSWNSWLLLYFCSAGIANNSLGVQVGKIGWSHVVEGLKKARLRRFDVVLVS